jgi:hypothetical protein
LMVISRAASFFRNMSNPRPESLAAAPGIAEAASE